MSSSTFTPEDLAQARLNKLPPDWEVVRVGQVASSQYGLSVATSAVGNVSILGMQQIQDGRVELDQTSRVFLSQAEIDSFRLETGDLLFNRTNSYDKVGKTGFFVARDNTPYVFASYLIRLKADEERLDPRFLAYFMNSHVAASRLKALATPGVSQYNINPTSLARHFLVPVPPVSEQAQIATILECWDMALYQLRALIRAKRRLKRGLMQQLLTGKRRFKGFVESKETRQTRFGTIPADWAYVQIGEIAHEVIARGNGASLPVLSCTKHTGLVESLRYFGRQVFSRDLSRYKVVRHGQFAYATNHIEEGSIGLLFHLEAGMVSPMYTVFETTERVYAPFLFYLLKTELYRHIFEARTNTSVNRRGSLRWSQFARIHLGLPSLEEQERIASAIATVDKEVDLLNEQLRCSKEQKRGLMQKLLTGQVRVKV